MPLLKDLVSQVKTAFKAISSDTDLSDRMVAAMIRDVSLKFIKQQNDKKKLFASPNIFTILPCLQLEEVPLSECCDYHSPCTIRKSIQTIPRIAESPNYGLLIQGVYTLDIFNRKGRSIKYTTPNRYSNSLRLGLRNMEDAYWIMGNHLYVSNQDIEIVQLSAHFEDPVDFTLYNCDTPPACNPNPLYLEAKIPGFLLSTIIDEVLKILSATYERAKPDTSVDNKNEESHT